MWIKTARNMSYCRWENTYNALRDCYDSMEDGDEDDMNDSEKDYRKDTLKLCKKMGEMTEDYNDTEDDEDSPATEEDRENV